MAQRQNERASWHRIVIIGYEEIHQGFDLSYIYGVDIIQQNHSLIINKHNDYVETTLKIVILGIIIPH